MRKNLKTVLTPSLGRSFETPKPSQIRPKVRPLKIYTDTGTEEETKDIYELEIKLPSKGRHNLEAKVDIGAGMNVLPLQCFRLIFPEKLDAEGLPKKTALEPSKVELESNMGGILRGFEPYLYV